MYKKLVFHYLPFAFGGITIGYWYSGQAGSIGPEIQCSAGSKSSNGSMKVAFETECSKYKKVKNQWSLVLLPLAMLPNERLKA